MKVVKVLARVVLTFSGVFNGIVLALFLCVDGGDGCQWGCDAGVLLLIGDGTKSGGALWRLYLRVLGGV